MIKKAYSSNGSSCTVTFEVPARLNAQTAHLCGDFNQWDHTSHPMQRRADGSFFTALTLEPGHEYCFRYLLDQSRWENDWNADAYRSNPFGGDDSVLII